MNRWIISKQVDLWVMLAPVWLCWLICFLLPTEIIEAETPLWIWVAFVIGIDVSHVWSTIFRTYTDKEELRNHKTLLLVAPILCFVLAYALAAISFDFFWRCLAYLAVFHFVKQQYGFMRMYKAKSGDFRKKLFSDNFIIYLSMLYPILFWHLNADRSFEWFAENDFIPLHLLSESTLSLVNQVGTALYFLLLGVWLVEELIRKTGSWPKIVWILTTAGNWFIGIVYFNSDLVFTITNVVAHGIPYVALVVFYQSEKEKLTGKIRAIPLIYSVLLAIFVLAFAEEYLWDLMVYRSNVDFFGSLISYPEFEYSQPLAHLFLALLTVPQATHYVLDGFIWKGNDKNPFLKKVLLK